jgi:hypothetical protein
MYRVFNIVVLAGTTVFCEVIVDLVKMPSQEAKASQEFGHAIQVPFVEPKNLL